MAIEKTLNTRIKLKYDLYSNWSTNNPVLLAGEVALAYIPTGENNSVSVGEGAVNGSTPPQVLIKVGDGEHNYNDLHYVSALAADVLSACKSEASLRTFINGVIADAGIATNDAMEALAGRVTTVEGGITTLNGDENTAGSVAKAIKDAIDALNLADTYQAKGDYATKTELGDVDAKFANYKTAADQKAIDDEQDRRLGVIEGDYLKAADIANFETKDNVALKADKSVVDGMYTNEQIDTAVQGAKDYAKGLVDAIPAQTDYTVTCTDADHEAVEGIPAFKRHTLTQNGQTICTIDIPKELVVEAGSVKEVTEADTPYVGAKVGDKYIELVIANQDEPIYVPAKDLVDIYTAKDMTGIEGAEIQVAISNTNEISATLINGGITEEKLAEGVKTKLNKTWEEVGVAAGLVATEKGEREAADAELSNAIEAAKTEAANQAAVVLAEAQKYTDGINTALDSRLQTLEGIDHNDYVKKGDATGYGDILTKTEAQGLYQAQGNYATADQGAKADTALQEVVANDTYKVDDNGEPTTEIEKHSGLKVTDNNKIEIDDTIVWIFDCGTSV